MQNYLTFAELQAKLGGRSRSAIYVDLATGQLPQPMKLGRRNYWPEDELEAYLKERREKAVAE